MLINIIKEYKILYYIMLLYLVLTVEYNTKYIKYYFKFWMDIG